MKYNKSVIICSYLEGTIKDALIFSNWDLEKSLIICADGGLNLAMKEKIKADFLIGDFDSFNKDNLEKALQFHPDIQVIPHPSEKDLTDTALAIEFAIEKGCDEILVIGGMGGRIDHTLAVIQNLAYYSSEKITCFLGNANNLVFVTPKNHIILPQEVKGKYFSIFSFNEKVNNLSILGAKYTLSNYTMTNTYPVGISNQFINDQSVIIDKEGGKVIIVISKD